MSSRMVSLEEMRKQYEMNELNRSDLLESPTEFVRYRAVRLPF